MAERKFIHLHVHTAYSLLDGAIRIPELITTAGSYGMDSVAITDHGNMYGALTFYKQAVKAGLNPIVGCEIYLVDHDLRERKVGEERFHLLLLAMNYEGYQNLTRIVTRANLEGFYYKPRADFELVKEYNAGLIAASACLQGQIPQAILKGRPEAAAGLAEKYASVFKDRFYLEVQQNFIPEQKTVNEGLKDLAQRLGLPLLATNDCHYLHKAHAEAHDVLLAVQTGKTIDDPKRLTFANDEFYFKPAGEIAPLFDEFPEAVANSLEIAARCQLSMPKSEYHFPVFELDEGESLEGRLEQEARAGLEKRLAGFEGALTRAQRETYHERLAMELDVINRMRFPGYFLIVADFINWAKGHGIPVGPGRGSAAGSLVAYALKITDLDPLKYSLLFERFLNVERISMPDIDVDFCKKGRERVIEYVTQKYGGTDHVAQIITFGQMQAKAVVRDVGRAMGLAYSEVDRIAKLISGKPGTTLEKTLAEKDSKLLEETRRDPRVAKLIKVARALEGLPRHPSTHAAGVVIGDRPLVEYLPLYAMNSAEDGAAKDVVTQFDMHGVEEMGLVKFDFLGLKNLTIIDYTLQLLKDRGIELDMEKIDLEDQATFELLCAGDTTGVFQLESSGMRDLLVRLKPSSFDDVIALVALYRPGPLESGMVDNYVDTKHGRAPAVYPLPELEPILKPTYGVILYQEQVMQIASLLASYSLGEADLLRRAMGKKKPEVMAQQRSRFMQGIRDNGLDEKKGAYIFDLMAKFAGYGFNKSHSAAYALIAFQTAFLKAHYPVEFTAALMTNEVNNTDKIVVLINECRGKGLMVLPPDINASGVDFTVDGERIRFGLAAIKGVGVAAIESIIQAREADGPFKDLIDLAERVDTRRVNRKVIEALIKSGAFDSTGATRAQMANFLDMALDMAAKRQRDRESGQTSLFESMEGLAEEPVAWPDVADWDENLRLNAEKEVLGFYVSGHPLARFEQEMKLLTNAMAQEIPEKADKAKVRLAGLVVKLDKIRTKKGDPMAFAQLEDLTGQVEVIVFPELFKQSEELLEGEEPLIMDGEVTVDEKGENKVHKIIANKIGPLAGARLENAEEVCLALSALRMGPGSLSNLKGLVRRFSGEIPLTLKVVVPGQGHVVLATEHGVNLCTEFIDQVRQTLGERSLTLVLKQT